MYLKYNLYSVCSAGLFSSSLLGDKSRCPQYGDKKDGNEVTQKKFDFTNFTAKVAELNRLHKLVNESSELRGRTGKAEEIEHWKNAVKVWKEFSGFGPQETKFYLFENRFWRLFQMATQMQRKQP